MYFYTWQKKYINFISTIFFSVPPTIDPPLTDKIANAGDQVTLECVAAGSPNPTVEWYYRGSYYTGQRVIFKEYD